MFCRFWILLWHLLRNQFGHLGTGWLPWCVCHQLGYENIQVRVRVSGLFYLCLNMSSYYTACPMNTQKLSGAFVC